MIGYWQGPYEEEALPDPLDFVDPLWDLEERDLVIVHLRGGTPVNHMMGISECRICGCPNGSYEMTDGLYLWPSGLVHYVEAHNVRLPDEFVEHVGEFMVPHSDASLDWWRAAAPASGGSVTRLHHIQLFDDEDRAWWVELVGRQVERLIDATHEVRGSAKQWSDLLSDHVAPPPAGSIEEWLRGSSTSSRTPMISRPCGGGTPTFPSGGGTTPGRVGSLTKAIRRSL